MSKHIIPLILLALLTVGCSPPEMSKAERAVKEELNDPDSAQFSHEKVIQTDNDGATVCGLVNAKNAMGGYVGRRRFFVKGVFTSISDSGVAYLESSDEDTEFDHEWDANKCHLDDQDFESKLTQDRIEAYIKSVRASESK